MYSAMDSIDFRDLATASAIPEISVTPPPPHQTTSEEATGACSPGTTTSTISSTSTMMSPATMEYLTPPSPPDTSLNSPKSDSSGFTRMRSVNPELISSPSPLSPIPQAGSSPTPFEPWQSPVFGGWTPMSSQQGHHYPANDVTYDYSPQPNAQCFRESRAILGQGSSVRGGANRNAIRNLGESFTTVNEMQPRTRYSPTDIYNQNVISHQQKQSIPVYGPAGHNCQQPWPPTTFNNSWVHSSVPMTRAPQVPDPYMQQQAVGGGGSLLQPLPPVNPGSGGHPVVSTVARRDRGQFKPGRECKFCKNNGESPDSYRSHVLRNPGTGQLICPVLREHKCEVCGATGDDAHTKSYCPQAKREQKKSLPTLLKETKRQSDGSIRRGGKQ